MTTEIKQDRCIRLGIPLDLLFDRDTNKLSEVEKLLKEPKTQWGDITEKELKGGLRLPTKIDSGSGNIIIRGRPGSGKSILAMQLAQKCCELNFKNCDLYTRENRKYFTWFISLEETPDNIETKALSFGWGSDFYRVRSLNNLDELSHPKDYGEALANILNLKEKREKNGCKCPIKHYLHEAEPAHGDSDKYSDYHDSIGHSMVYVSSLSPRHMTAGPDEKYDIFEDRFQQIEHLLVGSKWLRDNKGSYPELAMVCIDSLNVFGDNLLTREQIYRLFDLFKRYEVIGVFLLEEDAGNVLSPDSRLHGDMIEYLADMVISLEYNEDSDYFLRYFEIVKSRYQHQVYGKHPFRIVRQEQSMSENNEKISGGSKNKQSDIIYPNDYLTSNKIGIVILPSLHYIVYGTGKTNNRDDRDENRIEHNQDISSSSMDTSILGFDNEKLLLPFSYSKKDIILIEGMAGTFKQTLSNNFLINGLLNGKNVLLITLKDRASFDLMKNIRIGDTVKNKLIAQLVNTMVGLFLKKTNEACLSQYIEYLNKFLLALSCEKQEQSEGVSKWPKASPDPLNEVFKKIRSRKDYVLPKQGSAEENALKYYISKTIYICTTTNLVLKTFVDDLRTKSKKKSISLKEALRISFEKQDRIEDFLKTFKVGKKPLGKIYSGLDQKQKTIINKSYISLKEKVTGCCSDGERNPEWKESTKEIHICSSQLITQLLSQSKTFIFNTKEQFDLESYFQSCLFRRTGEHKSSKTSTNRYGFKWFNGKGELEVKYLTEIAFASGYIMPEEFIQEIRNVLLYESGKKRPISHIVFSDVGLIGVSYPLLNKSQTAGELFLTALAHIVRNYEDLSFLMVGTTSRCEESDQVIGKARALADAVLKCSFCDVFGDRYVVIEGDGLIARPSDTENKPRTDKDNDVKVGKKREYGSYLPGVIIPNAVAKKDTFVVDMDFLEGLVGFGTGKLHRPGILFHAFEEGDCHRRYNLDIKDLLSFTFGVPSEKLQKSIANLENEGLFSTEDSKVLVESFNSHDSESLHHSLLNFGGKPLNKTIVSTVDEFSLSQEGNKSIVDNAFVELESIDEYLKPNKKNKQDKLIPHIKELSKKTNGYAWPYYSNVLFMAYRIKNDEGKDISGIGKYIKIKEGCDGTQYQGLDSWNDIYDLATSIRKELEQGEDWRLDNDHISKDERDAIKKMTSQEGYMHPLFEYYHYVPETMSCMLLDVAFSKISKNKKESIAIETLFNDNVNGKNFVSLHKLLTESERARIEWGKQYDTCQQEKYVINPHAAVFVCWYSQLRELLNTYPQLNDKLGVCALPGGGFTGEWYIGVSKNSVSVEIGKNLIKILCSPEEQYKRFINGVGLPLLQKFVGEKYLAWPYANESDGAYRTLWLDDIYNIHKISKSRTNIINYMEHRSTLATICKQLIPPCKKYMECAGNDYCNKIISRLKKQIKPS